MELPILLLIVSDKSVISEVNYRFGKRKSVNGWTYNIIGTVTDVNSLIISALSMITMMSKIKFKDVVASATCRGGYQISRIW